MPNSFATPWTVALQAPLPVGFPRQEQWSGLPFPSPGDLPNPGIKPMSPAWQADSLLLSHLGRPYPWLFGDKITIKYVFLRLYQGIVSVQFHDHVTDHALISHMIMHWSHNWSCTVHLAYHTLIMWLIMCWSCLVSHTDHVPLEAMNIELSRQESVSRLQSWNSALRNHAAQLAIIK